MDTAGASGPCSISVIVDSAVSPSSLRLRACSDSRSDSRRDSSDSSDVISPMVWAFASSARIRSTLAWAVVIRDSTSTTWSVTSCADSCRLSSSPMPLSWSRVAWNFAAGTRRMSVAVERSPLICRLSPPTNPPAPVANATAWAAAALTSFTVMVIVPE
ncbi:hypothetical protein GCM10020218_024040 [Dactylosporangium vinaceum]